MCCGVSVVGLVGRPLENNFFSFLSSVWFFEKCCFSSGNIRFLGPGGSKQIGFPKEIQIFWDPEGRNHLFF